MTSEMVWNHITNVIVHELDGVSWVQKDQYEPQEVLPALVYALAKERAGDAASDEPWFDGYLDPLQMKLLTYAFLYAATDDPNSARSADGSGANGARTRVAGFVGDLLGIPIDSITSKPPTPRALHTLHSPTAHRLRFRPTPTAPGSSTR